MRIIGIDPGLRITGYGCVAPGPGSSGGRVRAARGGTGWEDGPLLVEAGVIRLRTEDQGERIPIADRLLELHTDVSALIERLAPDAAAVEAVFAHYKHPATAIAMAHARGVILLAAKRAGLQLIELKPNEIKKFLTGHGHAGKEQMQAAVQARLGLSAPPEPPDVADAIAIALCAASREEGRQEANGRRQTSRGKGKG